VKSITSRNIEQMRNQLENINDARDATHTISRRIENMRIRFVKKHTQIRINKLRDTKYVVSQPIHKSDIIQGEAVIYLDDTSTKHLTLLIIPKSHILLV
jgi:lysozyme family protein